MNVIVSQRWSNEPSVNYYRNTLKI